MNWESIGRWIDRLVGVCAARCTHDRLCLEDYPHTSDHRSPCCRFAVFPAGALQFGIEIHLETSGELEL
jgi:hypothetical protein